MMTKINDVEITESGDWKFYKKYQFPYKCIDRVKPESSSPFQSRWLLEYHHPSMYVPGHPN